MMLKNQKIESVQALRGICALGVLLWHTMLFTGGYDSQVAIRGVRPASIMGVDMFFLICGFVIFISATTGRLGELQTQNASSFLIRRLVRIYPLYLICTLAIFVIEPSSARMTGELLIRSLFFLPVTNAAGPNFFEPALTVGWSITYEVVFYAIFAIALAFNSYALRAVWIWAVVGLGGMAFLTGNYGLVPEAMPTHFPALVSIAFNPLNLLFLVGILIGIAFRSGFVFKSPLQAGLVTAISFALCVAQYATNWNVSHGILGVGAPLAMLLASLVLTEKSFRLKIPRPLVEFGNISYSLYLTHPIAIWVALRINVGFNLGNPHGGWLMVGLTLLISVLLSIFSYLYIEKAFGVWASRKLREFATQHAGSLLPGRIR